MAQKQLSDIIEIIGGGTPATSNCDFWNGDIPWLSVVDFNNSQKYVSKTEKTITEKGLTNSNTKLLQKGDIIISARGTVGAIAILTKPMAFNQSCYGIRGKKHESHTDYIYYFIKSKLYELKQISHGGVFDTITKETLKNIEIDLPCITQQKAIAAVLSNLDDKIDLLHRQNTTLERMAEILFKYFFSNHKGEIKKLIECSELISRGITPRYINKEGITVLNQKCIRNKKINFTLSRQHDPSKKIPKQKLLKYGDILINSTGVGTLGRVAQFFGEDDDITVDSHITIVRPQKNISFYYLGISLSLKQDEIEFLGEGSTGQIELNRKILGDIDIIIPDKHQQEKFDSIIIPLNRTIISNQLQIRTLEKLRDTLLPKLMSGEVRVRVDE